MLGIDRREEPWAAYCIDRAVTTFGMTLDGELNSVEGKTSKEMQTKRERIFNRWIPSATSGPQFADPAKQKVT